jgi:hypothetical protein
MGLGSSTINLELQYNVKSRSTFTGVLETSLQVLDVEQLGVSGKASLGIVEMFEEVKSTILASNERRATK